MSARWLVTALLGPLLGCVTDPAPGLFRTKDESRSLECLRLSQAEAHARYPGEIPDLPGRSTGGAVDALVCSPRFLRPNERAPRDEAILSSLSGAVGEIIAAASAVAPGDLTWHVDAYYPDPRVAAKISVAARNDLVERGHRVSDRVPVLAAGDIAVLARMPPSEAYRTACARYFVEQVMAEHEALLSIMIVDRRESQLHAGVCRRGEWKWVQ